MSSSDPVLPRRGLLALLASVPLLAACGFRPVYGPGGAGAAIQNNIALPDPNSRDSYVLIRELENRIGRADVNAAYKLSLTLKVTEDQLAISRDDVTTRYRLLGRLGYTLTRLDGNSQVTRGQLTDFTAYSATGSTAATEASRQDAHERLMQMMTDLLVTRLEAALSPDAANGTPRGA